MPDPLVGLHPPELCSSRAAVRCLQRLSPLDVSRNPSSPPRQRADLCPRPARHCRSSVARDPNAGPVRKPEHTGSDEPAKASPPSGVCSSRESATPRRPFGTPEARSSPGLSTLQGSLPRDNARLSPGIPSWAFSHQTRTAGEPTLQGIDCREMGWSLSRLPTLLGFAAS
jgi:hypothetical protein